MIPIAAKSLKNATKVVCSTWAADSLRGRFARGAVWSLVGALVARGISLPSSVITARLLGREQFGQYGMILSTIAMLGVFAGLGLGVTATKYVAKYRTQDPERAGRTVAMCRTLAVVSGGGVAAGLFACAHVVAAATLNLPSLTVPLRIASALVLLNALDGAQTGALAGFEEFRTVARINLLRGIVTVPITVIAVFLWRLEGAVWASVVGAAVACLLSHASLRNHCRPLGIHARFWSGWEEKPLLWTFSAPAFLSGALTGPAFWAAHTMLVNQPGGYAEMGVFSAASQWRSAIGFIPGALVQFALPLLSNLSGERDFLRYRKALRWNLILTAGASLAIAVPIVVGAPQIMRLYGRGFEQGWLVLVLSAAAAAVSCMNHVVGTAILSSGSVWIGFAFNGLWAAVLLAGCYRFIPTNLAVGLAGSMVTAYIAHTAWQGAYLRYLMRAPYARR